MNTTRYGAVANAYDAFLTLTGFKASIERFLDRVPFSLPPSPCLLDVGCGTGLMSRYFIKRFPEAQIYATDIDVKMLGEMEQILKKEKLGDKKIIIAESNLIFPETIRVIHKKETEHLPQAYFDGVLASGALEHAPLAETIRRLVSLLRPGGMFLNLGMRRSPLGAALGMMYGIKPYKIVDICRAFQNAGLGEVRVLKLTADEFPANLSRVAILGKKLKS